MTALELNAELFRQLSIIAEDETLMRKAVEAIRRLAQQKEAQTEETEYSLVKTAHIKKHCRRS